MRAVLILVAILLLSLAVYFGLKRPSVSPQVQEYVSKLPKANETSGKPDFVARKDTLHYSGNFIIGNFIAGDDVSAACNTTNTMAFPLSSIDHFDDLGPCPQGSSVVRAVLKP